MLFHPATMALNLAAVAGTLALLLAAGFAVRILRHWDIASGSELQLRLERQTYLVSTLLGVVFAAELISLFLFVFTADKLAVMFVGAMCAVGTLNASPLGFPALMLKIGAFFAAGTWLVMNAVDNRGWDYPMVKAKYALLLALLPLFATAAAVQLGYFADLKADVLVSCCSRLFTGSGSSAAAAGLSTLPPVETLAALYGTLAALAAAAWLAWRRPAWTAAYSVLSAAAFVVAIAAVISTISPYVYEQPHHHCPFCLMKPEYGYVGYLLYVPLFAATTLGIGLGPVQAFRRTPSLRDVVPAVSRRLLAVSLGLFLVFGLVAAYAVAASGLRM